MPKNPPHFVERRWRTRKGMCVAYYYQHPRDPETGKRRLEPLGTDRRAALEKWAAIEGERLEPAPCGTLEAVHREYMAWAEKIALSRLSPRTIRDRRAYWRALGPVFGHMPVDDIAPEHLLEYFERRSSQVSAKKEIKYLSVLFNWARARGKMRANNPALGITRQMQVDERRRHYVDDHSYRVLWEIADQVVRDMMEFSYLCGNRPAESVNARWSDVQGDTLIIRLAKTEKSGERLKRLPVEGSLRGLLARLQRRPVLSTTILCDERGQTLRLTGQLRYRFMQARQAAGKVEGFVPFRLQDLRAKAATDTALEHGLEAARRLLGHSTQKQTADYIRPLMGQIADRSPDLDRILEGSGTAK